MRGNWCARIHLQYMDPEYMMQKRGLSAAHQREGWESGQGRRRPY